MFTSETRYLIHRKDPILWEQVLHEDNPYRQLLIDKVNQVVSQETEDSEEISIAIKALMMLNASSK